MAPGLSPLEPARLEEITGFFARNNEEYLALIFEKEGSYLGREVTLDLSQHQGIAVRRVLNTERDVVNRFGVTNFPSCYLLSRNGSFSRVPALTESRSFYTTYLRKFSGSTRGLSRPQLRQLPPARWLPPCGKLQIAPRSTWLTWNPHCTTSSG